MGKNKIRSKNRPRKDKTSISDNSGSSMPSTSTSTSTSAHGNVFARSTSNASDRRPSPAEPPRKSLAIPTTTSLKNTTTSTPSSGTSPAAPTSRSKGPDDKRDSVMSSTWKAPKRHSTPAKKPTWRLKPSTWWPCRTMHWLYDLVFALVRIQWTQQQTLKDLILTLTLIGLVIAGCYTALEFLLKAVPGVAAQTMAVDGNCSIVYVTVPGPIITVSLINASPTDPARGTYYFSVVNSTTEWLNSVAPPTEFNTLPTRTAVETPYGVSSGYPPITSSEEEVGEASSLPGPVGQPQRPYPSFPASTEYEASSSYPEYPESSSYPDYPASTSYGTDASGSYTPVSTRPDGITSPVVPASTSALPGPEPDVPSSAPGEVSSELPSESGLPVTSDVPTTLATSPAESDLPISSGVPETPPEPPFESDLPISSDVPASLTTSLPEGSATPGPDTTIAEGSPQPSGTPSDEFTVSLAEPTPGPTLTVDISSTASDVLGPEPSLPSSIDNSPFPPSTDVTPPFSTTPADSPSSLDPSIPDPVLTTSEESSSFVSPTEPIPSPPLTSDTEEPSSISELPPAVTSSPPLEPTPSAFDPERSTGFATLLPVANSSSTLSSNFTSSSSTLSVSDIITSSTVDSSSLEGTSTSIDGIVTVQTDTTAFLSLSSSDADSPSTETTTLTLTTTTSPEEATPAPPSFNDTALFGARAMTKVISYGDAAVSFVFPSPNISTTVSYWTGTYPTVTGPLPSGLQTIPLTTRTERLTPISALPSFELFSSRPRRFKTVVTTIYEPEDGSNTALAKRQDIPISLDLPTPPLAPPILATTTVPLPDLPGPSSCGESGNFTLTFDDTVVGEDDDTILLVANGMKNPYHHLFYSNGYTYVPDKWEPYPSISQPNVAIFLPLTGRLLPNTPFAGTMLPGELGGGPRASVNAYWFNAYSGYFGCALNGLTPCTLRMFGYRYDDVLQEEVLVAEQNATIPACFGYINCQLTQIFFNEEFRALSGIQFNAYTYNLGIPQVHMMDDLQMEWYNNSCSAGILRIGHS